jgi:hypothetical protein
VLSKPMVWRASKIHSKMNGVQESLAKNSPILSHFFLNLYLISPSGYHPT